MYKGQFAKWKWTKYNKGGNPNSTKSRVAKKMKSAAGMSPDPKLANAQNQEEDGHAWDQQDAPPEPQLGRQIQMFHFGDEDFQVESTLRAYAALILHWAEQETPWRATYTDPDWNQLYNPQQNSILQLVRTAHGLFITGNPGLGGVTLRQAFLGIESAVDRGLDVETLWDCCLAVPQLVMATGWTDMLCIFAKFLYELTNIKLPGHPINKIAKSLYKLSRHGLVNWQLEMYVGQGWLVWIDCLSHVRGRQDHLTIHLKRGYVTLIDPHHKMAQDILCDFANTVHESLANRGAAATTSHILELEHLLVRMFAPLFTLESATQAKAMLVGILSRIEGNPRNMGLPATQWTYMDRYLVFSANHFLASISDINHDGLMGSEYRRRSLDSPRDVFWLQTSLLLEQRLRADGNDIEAHAIMLERTKVRLELEGLPYPGDL